MGNSLFDQLKKQGLVDKQKAQELKHSQYKNKKQKTKTGSAAEIDAAKLLAQQAQAEKVERDRQLNKERKEAADHKAISAQIRQLIETNRVTDREGEVAYHFTDANVVKCIYVSANIHQDLSRGRLCIVKLGTGYELVPTPVATKIRQRDETYVIQNEQTTDSSPAENDPYADYKIPDDLMW